ncbi:MAG: carotenoid oxygenase family protein [Actinomycetota bacterium]
MTTIESRGKIEERNPYLEGNYAPIHTEITAHDLPVVGELPADIDGMYVRIGSNPMFSPVGRYHWFDGDGMLHGIQFSNGSATYRNRWVRTVGLAAEESAGKALWTGIREPADFARAGGPYKDTANTTLTFHAGKLLAHWWLGGASYVIDVPSLETVGVEDFGGGLHGGMSAHPKVDPETGEMIFFDYGPTSPYLTYGVIGADGHLKHQAPIELPGPRLQHDIAITPSHSILLDMSMMWDPDLLAKGRVRNGFFRDKPTRLGVIPRFGSNDDVRWFDGEPFFMYHTINAWEDGDEIVMTGCRIDNPLLGDPLNPHTDRIVPSIATLRLEPHLHQWRIQLSSGIVKEERIDETMGEFPTMDDRSLGRPTRLSYMPRMAEGEALLFDGVMVYDGDVVREQYSYPNGWYGGEVTFAPRTGATKREDDGYLVTFVAEEATGSSEAYVFDASRVADGPVARLPIPQRVPTGYHTEWVPAV